jgi:hypothetical protein
MRPLQNRSPYFRLDEGSLEHFSLKINQKITIGKPLRLNIIPIYLDTLYNDVSLCVLGPIPPHILVFPLVNALVGLAVSFSKIKPVIPIQKK